MEGIALVKGIFFLYNAIRIKNNLYAKY